MTALFLKKYKAIDKRIAIWAPPNKKQLYLTTFSSTKWQCTAEGRKTLHILSDCKCCMIANPIESGLFKKGKSCVVSKRKPFTELRQQAKEMTVNIPKPSQKEIRNIGTAIYNEFNTVCNNQLGKSFGEVLSMVPEAALQKKPSPAEKKKKNREQKRKFKKNVENSWKKNDVSLHLAQRTSFAARKRQRLEECFETVEEAKERVIKAPKRQKRSHCPSSVEGNFEQLMHDVSTWTTVNWSEKGKLYNIRKTGDSTPPPNAGQLLKKYLNSEGVDTEAFDQQKSKYMNM